MKGLITLTVVAIVAIVLLEINESSAQRNRQCKQKPELNSTEVTCDKRPLLRCLMCARQCADCYPKEKLQKKPGCLVNKQCTCLARPEQSETTTEIVETSPADESTADTGIPSDEPTTPSELDSTLPAEDEDIVPVAISR